MLARAILAHVRTGDEKEEKRRESSELKDRRDEKREVRDDE